tara:strand:+ start:1418 stop:1603 length:186 start_codon:yes stop_codon:yes gene_type:complete
MNATNTARLKEAGRPLWVLLCLSALAGSSVALSACNTVEGVGRDVESVGDSVADTADDAKD